MRQINSSDVDSGAVPHVGDYWQRADFLQEILVQGLRRIAREAINSFAMGIMAREERPPVGILWKAAQDFSRTSRCEPHTARKVTNSSSVLSALITGNSRLFLIML